MRRGSLAGAARCCEPRGISPEMRRAVSRGGSRRICPTGPEEEEGAATGPAKQREEPVRRRPNPATWKFNLAWASTLRELFNQRHR
ncbi:hypothetical protein VPH35_136289 [Triticum aestivum]